MNASQSTTPPEVGSSAIVRRPADGQRCMIQRYGGIEPATYDEGKRCWRRDYCQFLAYHDEVSMWWSLDEKDGHRPPSTETTKARHGAKQPEDKEHDSEVKTAIARVQMDHLNEFHACFCAKCRLRATLAMSYKCRWCGVWYCHFCAAQHFGPESENDPAQTPPAESRAALTCVALKRRAIN